MRIDITKIDDRINKLQTIRRIASDPEMSRILLEFLVSDEGPYGFSEKTPGALHEHTSSVLQPTSFMDANNPAEQDEAGKLVSEIIGKTDAKPGAGTRYWGKTKS